MRSTNGTQQLTPRTDRRSARARAIFAIAGAVAKRRGPEAFRSVLSAIYIFAESVDVMWLSVSSVGRIRWPRDRVAS